MDQGALNLFIINAHQVFFGILAVIYCCIALGDLESVKNSSNLDKRRFFTAIFSVMFLGLAFSFYGTWKEAGIFFSVEFALFIVLSFLNPKYAAGFFVFLLLTRPWETFDNDLMETMPRDFFYVTLLSLVGHKIANKDFSIRLNLGSLLMGFFAIWCFFSAFMSPYFSDAIVKYVEVFSKGVILFFLIQNAFKNSRDLLTVKAALVLSILEMGVISARNTLIKQNSSLGGEEFQRLEAVGILSNSNDIAAILVLALPFCVFFFLRKNMRGILWPLSLASFGLISYLIWSSQSRGALLALFACVCAFFFTKISSKKTMALVVVVGLLGALGAFSLLKRKGADLEGSTNNRIIYWMSGMNMAARNPLFGVGFWGFNKNFAGYAIDGNTGTEGKEMTAHSAWVQVMAETGYVGFAAFFGLWIFGARRAWLIRKEEPEYFTSIVGYGVAITFLSHGYQLYPYILLSLGITHSFLVQPEKENALVTDKVLKLPLTKEAIA